MSEAETSKVDTLVESELDARVKKLEDKLSADVLAFSGRIAYGADLAIRDAIEWRQEQKPKRKKIAFFLETGGGYIEIAQHIASTLRKHYDTVDFYVPDAAMSAGTVLVMSGDAIHMDYYSILGPIDPQLPTPDGRGLVPALGYLKKFEELMEKAAEGSLNTAETTYLLNMFDPAVLYKYEKAIELSVFLLEEWLAKYKFKNWKTTKTKKSLVTPKMRRDRAREIAKKLNDTDKWHTHGHGISMAVLRSEEIKLEIEDFEKDKDLWKQIRDYWSLLTDYMTKMGHRGVIHVKKRYKPLIWQ
jgi:membrane-bound ClpP family serine protease